MKENYQISIILDKRRKKKNDKYPVRLQVFTIVGAGENKRRIQKRYATKFNYTVDEYKSIWLTEKPRKVNKQAREEIQALESKANKVAKKLDPFTIENFEKGMYRKPGDGLSVKYQYQEIISELRKRSRYGSVSAYEYSMKSISEYVERKDSFEHLTLTDITPKWLQNYEKHAIEDNKLSLTTVGFQLRALRAVFNKAIEDGEMGRELYPFGKRKYQIPAGSNTKKALSQEQLGKLLKATPGNPEQERARDFWFFSYACSGMNVKDIAQLRSGDIQDGKLVFYRAKTRNTSKGNLKPITVYLNEFSAAIIKKYSKSSGGPKDYVFNIISDNMAPEEKHYKVKSFTRFVNQHIKTLAKTIGLPEQISTYWARHSYATNAVRQGASLEFVQENLGHGNLKTTQAYFSGFDSEIRKEFAQKIMDFD